MRFYSRYPDIKKFRTKRDQKNWEACHYVLKRFSKPIREILLEIYSEGDTIPDNVYQVSKRLNIEQDVLWNLIADMESKIAKKRGL